MKRRTKPTGYRQAAWEALHFKGYDTVKDLAEKVGCAESGLRNYIRGLEANGYIQREPKGRITLLRRTGETAPSFNINTREFHDWNLGENT